MSLATEPHRTVVLIDYGSGNVHSALNALKRITETLNIADKVNILLSDKPEDISRADAIILPGVGAFAACKEGIMTRPGLFDAMEKAVKSDKKPFLGICVGMQFLATTGYENGVTAGFDYIPGEVRRFTDSRLKIPHISWATLEVASETHPLLNDIQTGDYVYYVHSYRFHAENPAHILATSDYGGAYPALIARDNIAGAQFHPEKSQKTGLKLLENFLFWNP